MFAARLPDRLDPNRLALAVEKRRVEGKPFIDLTLSNPTQAGFEYPATLLADLAKPAALCYEPQPLGLLEARRAVCADFARRGIVIAPERVVMTASTSESYSILFKLLCDPGISSRAAAQLLLVEHLARLEGVGVEFYEIEWHGDWAIDLEESLAGALATTHAAGRIRALVVVSPNNPTGSRVKHRELQALASLCRQHEIALVSDEVFADYSVDETGDGMTSALVQNQALTFGLGGLSKTIGLPQVKLGWCGVNGPDDLVCDALSRLETICDTYLSVSTPVQVAAADLFARGAAIRGEIAARVKTNYDALRVAAAASPACRVLRTEAGWYAVLQVPATRSEEVLALDLLEKAGVLVHPGYFFDFSREAFLVLSLLPPAEVFAPAIERMFGEVA